MEFPSSSSVDKRRNYFIHQDPGLASMEDLQPKFSGNNSNHQNTFISRPLCYSMRNHSINLSLMTSPPRSSGRFHDARFEDRQSHFLDSCFLCNKSLSDDKDIFMYRGDTPFCSEECRQEQIETDEAKEKKSNLSSSMKALRKKDLKNSSSTTYKQQQSNPRRTRTIVAS